MRDKHDGHCQVFTGGALVGLQVFSRVWTLCTCMKTIGCDCYVHSFVQ